MKKRDGIIVAAVLLLAGLTWLLPRLFLSEENTCLQITVDGDVYGTYSLLEDQEIAVGATNVCKIENGVVTMIEAKCPDHLCIKQRAIDKKGGTIVCLPNRVVLEIINAEENEVDIIAK
ncbi:MAG: NusG domain II-containing protein [Lachnospiraceae bacterium]|jgi:hypothetical protein